MATEKMENLTRDYLRLLKENENIKAQLDVLKAEIEDEMLREDVVKVDTDFCMCYFTADSERVSVDHKKMAKENPSLYKLIEDGGYISTKKVCGNLTIKGKKVLVEAV